MKNFLILLVLILIGYLIWTEVFREFQPPNGYLLVHQADWDSATKLPDTIEIIQIDTIPSEKDTVWMTPEIPIPKPFNGVNFYVDSIYTAHMELFIQDSIQGILTHRRVGYNLLVPERIIERREIIKVTPMPVRVKEYVPPVDWQYYTMAGVGIGGYGMEGGLIRRERWMFGIQGLRIDNNGYVLAKVGIQF